MVSFTPPDPRISETAWTGVVIGLAQSMGWLANHQRPARTKDGWRTTIQGDDGFPDVVMVHGVHGTVFVELKDWRGKLQPNQERWRDKILASGGRWYLLRPSDFDKLVAILSGGV